MRGAVRNVRPMKTLNLFITFATLMAMTACEKAKPISEKTQDGVNDALDRRPGEMSAMLLRMRRMRSKMPARKSKKQSRKPPNNPPNNPWRCSTALWFSS